MIVFFFFKQKAAYEVLRRLVGSEMCIMDRFLSHASYEIGYRLAARELGLEPCLLLGMRLGEGSGCPLLFRILQGACAVLDGMATFPEAAIEDGYLAPIREGDAFTVDKS